MYEKLIEQLKKFEGFSGNPYTDTQGYETIGIGTKLPLTEEEAELLLQHRLKQTVNNLNVLKLDNLDIKEEAKIILYDMAYNLGTKGLLGFKKMWLALENKDYLEASKQMKDSKWYHQVGRRSKYLVEEMEKLNYI